jgi:hypothetical protein
MGVKKKMSTHKIDGMCAQAQGIHAIEGCGSSICVQNIVKKTGKIIERLKKLIGL